MSEQITTAEERDDLLRSVGEQAEPAVIRVGFRPYILTENERGEFWGWSWIEEGERRGSVKARGLALPWTVLYHPDAPAGATVTREAVEAAWSAWFPSTSGPWSVNFRWRLYKALADLGLTVADTPAEGGER